MSRVAFSSHVRSKAERLKSNGVMYWTGLRRNKHAREMYGFMTFRRDEQNEHE
jgi:hypothetical protein